jgi:hypothetical protein
MKASKLVQQYIIKMLFADFQRLHRDSVCVFFVKQNKSLPPPLVKGIGTVTQRQNMVFACAKTEHREEVRCSYKKEG